MEDHADSPLSTKQKRDRLVRRPLHELAQGVKTPGPTNRRQEKSGNNILDGVDTITPTNYGIQTRKSNRRGGLLSPANEDFKESSPALNKSKDTKISTPEMSIIPPKRSPRGQDDKQNKSTQSTTKENNNSKSRSEINENLAFESSSQSDEETPTISRRTNVSKNSSNARRNLSKMSDANYTAVHSIIETKEEESSSSWCYNIFMIITILMTSGVMLQLYQNDGFVQGILEKLDLVEDITPIIAERGESFQRFKRDLEKIKNDFPNQNTKTWSVVSSQVRSIMYGSATQPSCILMVNNQTAKGTSQCLIKSVGTSIFYALNHGVEENLIQIKAGDLPTDPTEAKGKLFELIKQSLMDYNVVILQDIQDLHAITAMALHGICDEGFMFDQKMKPVVLMTMSDFRSESELDKEQKDISSLIRSLWEPELGVDKVYPLISRISAASVKIITDDVKALPLKYC